MCSCQGIGQPAPLSVDELTRALGYHYVAFDLEGPSRSRKISVGVRNAVGEHLHSPGTINAAGTVKFLWLASETGLDYVILHGDGVMRSQLAIERWQDYKVSTVLLPNGEKTTNGQLLAKWGVNRVASTETCAGDEIGVYVRIE